MRKFNLYAILLVTLFTVSLSGCKDDEDEAVSPKTAFLTEAEWTGEGIYVGNSSLIPLLELAGEDDLSEQLDISSSKIKFEKDGTFTGSANGLADSGKWKFTDNENKIVITDSDNEETTFTVKQLNSTNLNLELSLTDLGLQPIVTPVSTITTVELRFIRP